MPTEVAIDGRMGGLKNNITVTDGKRSQRRGETQAGGGGYKEGQGRQRCKGHEEKWPPSSIHTSRRKLQGSQSPHRRVSVLLTYSRKKETSEQMEHEFSKTQWKVWDHEAELRV